MRIARYWRLLRVQLRASALLALQYRSDFLVDGAISIFWTVTAILPLLTIFHVRKSVAGWSYGEALIVVGWFTLMDGILEGAIHPSLATVVDHIRKGTLDFVLLKPADAQFLVSTVKFLPWRAINVLSALFIFAYGFHLIGRAPSLLGIVSSMMLSITATMILYALWILTVSAAFYVVKIDNLTALFSSVFDAARWPSSVFRGALRIFFTFVIPLALMTTFPAQALLGRLTLAQFAIPIVGSAVFFAFARSVWLKSIGKYTSASS